MPFVIGGGSFVEVETDQGLVGIGPTVDEQFIPAIKAYLIGKDPFDVEQHAVSLQYFVHGMPYRGVAGVDIALWDLIGKASSQPLYKL
jgi:D-arabinonate dehydratase/D-galactarolactone cycloisomerase